MQRSACLPSRRAWSSRAASSPAASPCARLGVLEPPGWRPEPPVPSRLPAVPPGSLALAVPPWSSVLAVPPWSSVLAVPPATLVPPAPVRRVRPRRARRSPAPPRRPGRSSPPASVAPSLPCRLPAGAPRDPLREPLEQRPPDLRMGQLTSTELDRDLDPIAILQELDRPPDLRVEVAATDLGLETDLLEGDRALLALGLLLALRQLVLVLTEVEKTSHRGLCHRGDLDEVVPPLLRHRESLCRGHHAQLGSLFVNHPDLWDPDHLVYAQVSADGQTPSCCGSCSMAKCTSIRRPGRGRPRRIAQGF